MLDQFIVKWGMRVSSIRHASQGWRVRLMCETNAYRASSEFLVFLPNQPTIYQVIQYLVAICDRLEESSRQSTVPDRQERQRNKLLRQNLINLLGFDGYLELLTAAKVT